MRRTPRGLAQPNDRDGVAIHGPIGSPTSTNAMKRNILVVGLSLALTSGLCLSSMGALDQRNGRSMPLSHEVAFTYDV